MWHRCQHSPAAPSHASVFYLNFEKENTKAMKKLQISLLQAAVMPCIASICSSVSAIPPWVAKHRSWMTQQQRPPSRHSLTALTTITCRQPVVCGRLQLLLKSIRGGNLEGLAQHSTATKEEERKINDDQPICVDEQEAADSKPTAACTSPIKGDKNSSNYIKFADPAPGFREFPNLCVLQTRTP